MINDTIPEVSNKGISPREIINREVGYLLDSIYQAETEIRELLCNYKISTGLFRNCYRFSWKDFQEEGSINSYLKPEVLDPIPDSLTNQSLNISINRKRLNQSFDFAFGEIEKLNQRLEETERVFSSYKANNEQKINEHLQLFHDMGEQHQQTVDSLKRDLVDKDHLICEKSRQINSLYDEIDSLHKTITELETTYAFVSVADDSLDSLSPEQLKERYQEMVRNNEAERLILNSNLSKLSLFQKRLDAARYDLGFKNDEIAQLKTQFEQQKESLKKEIISQKALEIDLLNKTIIELKLAHRRVEQNLNDNITHLNDELQKEKISARSKEEAKDETITILNEKNYNFQITIKDLKKQVSNLNVQLQNKIEDIKYLRSDRRLALIGSSMQGIVDWIPDSFSFVKNPIKNGIQTISGYELFHDAKRSEILYEGFLLALGSILTIVIPFLWNIIKLTTKRIGRAMETLFSDDNEPNS